MADGENPKAGTRKMKAPPPEASPPLPEGSSNVEDEAAAESEGIESVGDERETSNPGKPEPKQEPQPEGAQPKSGGLAQMLRFERRSGKRRS